MAPAQELRALYARRAPHGTAPSSANGAAGSGGTDLRASATHTGSGVGAGAADAGGTGGTDGGSLALALHDTQAEVELLRRQVGGGVGCCCLFCV